ncbi:putative LmbE-like protein [Sphaerochaeta pleomorpha str. Grapes]|uniref:Putative LmbE-like protein n=1 Tax=Sphaerochaeta pleomorpha (strain ATCC BAA-1885 / DSM 22778 / Grapes) TaxID=158190 RepID=G8QRP5_SPHPG|nr:PIG-L family deacetylase [Sphaerochaeta pleomorpha]AEV28828.1 putative LmbE-like protein [Sphaerochaeta pleomorpha str. Grapes]
MDINQFFSTPDITRMKHILCIQPHPDDNEIGMGGIIAALAKKGCTIEYLTVTNGDLGLTDPTLTCETLAKLRRQEAIAAGKKLGVSQFHFLDHGDGSLESIPTLAAEIAKVIRTIQPEAIFCPDPWAPYEAHNDHIVTGKAASQAFISSALLQYPRGTKTNSWQVQAIGFYFTNNVNTVIDITDTFALKFEAIAEHKTQMNDQMLALFTAYFQMRGQKLASGHDFSLGEGLKVLRPEHMHCFAEANDI